MRMIKTYSEVIRLDSFLDRFNYLKLNGSVGDETFGWGRYLNQYFYRSAKWKKVRNEIIIRDNGCDLAMDGYEVCGDLILVHGKLQIPNIVRIHHINPITMDDVENDDPCLYDPENLIMTTLQTHNAIHYGDSSGLLMLPEERKPFDTCPWR